MPRRKRSAIPAEPTPAKKPTTSTPPGSTPSDTPPQVPAVHVIYPRGLYFPNLIRPIFRTKNTTLRREWKNGRLRIAKRAGRIYVLGQWLIEWIQKGEVKPRRRPSARDAVA